MTDRYHGQRWHRIEYRSRFDDAVLAALRVAVVGRPGFATSWKVVAVLASTGNVVTAATKLPAGARVSARSVGEALKRLERDRLVARVVIWRTYKTRPSRPRPYPGWRPK